MAEVEQEKERRRSPNYPSISLQAAVAKARQFYEKDKGAAATAEVLASHWGTTIKSSTFLQAVGSLRQYGLLTDIEGSPRRLKLTRDALDVVMLSDSDEKHVAAIKRAALAPKLFKKLWDLHGINVPSDENLRHELVTTMEFLPDAAADAIKQFKRNIEFAKLTNGDKIGESDGNDRPKVGDFVQVVFDGKDQLPSPTRVTMVDGQNVYVEGCAMPIPVEQTRVEQPLKTAQQELPPHLKAPPRAPGYTPPIFSAPGSKQDIFTLDSGSVVVQWPQSLTKVEFEDIKEWVEILLRKIKRSVKPTSDEMGGFNLKDDSPAKIEMDPQ